MCVFFLKGFTCVIVLIKQYKHQGIHWLDWQWQDKRFLGTTLICLEENFCTKFLERLPQIVKFAATYQALSDYLPAVHYQKKNVFVVKKQRFFNTNLPNCNLQEHLHCIFCTFHTNLLLQHTQYVQKQD